MHDGEPPSVRVVRSVAEREGVDPDELEAPLYEAIEPEALDALFRPSAGNVTVQFEYNGYAVDVEGPDAVSVRKPCHPE